jgi:two-component system response regulator AlgR
MLEQLPDYEVVGYAANGLEAIEKYAEFQPDVIFMDIRMPVMDGLQAARHIANSDTPPAIVFCTAYDEYAINAFESNAVGYLLKPATLDKLTQALQQASRVNKLQALSLQSGESAISGGSSQRTHVSANTHLGVELVEVDDVRAFVADHKYVTAVHRNGEILIDDTLKELETEFNEKLLRVHRNTLVALASIKGIERQDDGSYCVLLADVALRPRISRRHLPAVRRLIKSL